MDKSKWEYKKLGEVATFERGLTYSKKDESDSSTKGVLRSNNIDLDSHQLVFDEIKWLNETFEIPQSKKLAKDSIFICMSNGSKTHLGKVAFIDKDYDYAFGGFMGMIKPLNIYPKYLFYYFLSKEYRDGLEQIGKGANINNLRFAQLANFMIPNPITEVQQRIVAELDCLNEMIALKQEQLNEFDKLAQSIFYDMFGDPISNEKGWGKLKMKDICEIIAGGDKPDNLSVIKTDDYCYPVIANGDGDKGILGYSRTRRVVKDSVTIGARGASIGNCRIVYGGFTPVVRLISLTPNDQVNCIYLYYFAKQMPYFSTGAGQAQLTVPNVKMVTIPLPPLELQQQFAEKIQAIEAQKELVKKSIAETQQLLDSRMDYYFD